jgi:hypothetical protein
VEQRFSFYFEAENPSCASSPEHGEEINESSRNDRDETDVGNVEDQAVVGNFVDEADVGNFDDETGVANFYE